MMTIQMIRRNIQNRRYVRCKIISCLQLKTADLRHSYGFFRRITGDIRIGYSDVPHYKGLSHIVLHDLSGQSRRSGLSVRPCDGDESAFRKAIRQLHLSPDGNSSVSQCLNPFRIYRYTRT